MAVLGALAGECVANIRERRLEKPVGTPGERGRLVWKESMRGLNHGIDVQFGDVRQGLPGLVITGTAKIHICYLCCQ